MDCGCRWSADGTKIPFFIKDLSNNYSYLIEEIDFGKCKNRHKLNAIDSYLINDFSGDGAGYLMVAAYIGQILGSVELDLCNFYFIYSKC